MIIRKLFNYRIIYSEG